MESIYSLLAFVLDFLLEVLMKEHKKKHSNEEYVVQIDWWWCRSFQVDIAVGTLSKISFYVKHGDLDVSNVRFLVLDEADDLMKNDERNEILT